MKKKSSVIFVGFGSLAVIAGGLLSAFVAGNPSYVTSWAVAYIVLIVGVVQIALGLGVGRLARRQSSTLLLTSAFLAFNLGNAAVISGTVIKYATGDNTILVDIGSLLTALAMIFFIRLVRGATKTKWLIAYYILVGVVFVSMVVGVFLATKSA